MDDGKITEYILSAMMVGITIISISYLGNYLPPLSVATPSENILGLLTMLFIIHIFIKNLPKTSEGISELIVYCLPKKFKESFERKMGSNL